MTLFVTMKKYVQCEHGWKILANKCKKKKIIAIKCNLKRLPFIYYIMAFAILY